MIDKPTIIITSLGRTGTKFFAKFFQEVIPTSTSIHEPDVFTIGNLDNKHEKIEHLVVQIGQAGLFNLFRKLLGRWSLVSLSDSRLRGASARKIEKSFFRQRQKFINSRPGRVYIESSFGYYGLIDILSNVFEQHRVAFIIRDGRDWVRSWMSWGIRIGVPGAVYGKSRAKEIIGHSWPTAKELRGDEYQSKWDFMSAFEKFCWAWDRLNSYALKTMQENPNAKIFRFEDIFKSNNRYENLKKMVNFVTDMPGVGSADFRQLDGWLDYQIHKSGGKFPAWSGWTSQQKQQFTDICGSLMDELGYEIN